MSWEPLVLQVVLIALNAIFASAEIAVISKMCIRDSVTYSLLRMTDQTSAIYQWMGTHIWLLHLVFDLVVIAVFVLLSAYIINPVREKKVRKKKG